MFLAGPTIENPLASKLASDFRPFNPGIIHTIELIFRICYAIG